jgi:hypothetical protein
MRVSSIPGHENLKVLDNTLKRVANTAENTTPAELHSRNIPEAGSLNPILRSKSQENTQPMMGPGCHSNGDMSAMVRDDQALSYQGYMKNVLSDYHS